VQAPLTDVAQRRAWELAVEAVVPLFLAGGLWTGMLQVLSAPSEGQALSSLELAVLLGALAGMLGWAVARQLWVAGWQRLWLLVGVGLVVALVGAWGLGTGVAAKVEGTCSTVGGDPVMGETTFGEVMVGCHVSAVENNPYLTGALLRPRWTGHIPLWGWLWTAAFGVFGVVAGRDVRLFRSAVPFRYQDAFRWEPGGGSQVALGEDKVSNAQVTACSNPTWWGEPCGQIYSSDKVWAPGEWCGRCRLPFQADDERYTFDIVVPALSDVTRLNAMERLDAVAWEPGTPLLRPEASVSGRLRWHKVHRITVPGVLSVSQLLALVWEALPGWGGDDAATAEAVAQAHGSGSRLAAWFWAGRVSDRLHLATPTRAMVLAAGPRRLREFIPGLGQELTLQIDTGVCPIELRSGFVHRVREVGDTNRTVQRNLRVVTWIPTAPSEVLNHGLWLPRLEGAALRRWLATQRNQPRVTEGVTVPAEYVPYTVAPTTPRVMLVDMGTGEEGTDALPTLQAEWEAVDADLELHVVDGATAVERAASAVELQRSWSADLVVVDLGREVLPAAWTLIAGLRIRLNAPQVAVLGATSSALSEAARRGIDGQVLVWTPVEPEEASRLQAVASDAARRRRHLSDAFSIQPESGLLNRHDGRFDYRRYPLRSDVSLRGRPQVERLWTPDVAHNIDPIESEPDLTEAGRARTQVGRSIGEWDWFELGQLAQLRREVLVMRPMREA